MSTTPISSSRRAARSVSRISSAWQQVAVVLFGALVLYAVGFLPMSAAHNAAHDTRHSFVFPCH
ncbi:cobalt transporter subunit CbtB [Modicisalibacter xianhensis]|uniref:Cobalt transporter subunit CbtB n=1 Tax=Modicisalibacter xianhensis TaxID=442341 RepID=A0A4R8FSV1_9GAMM|nr:CbtB domain-containing protein [Halomonas xianhensis]TDX29514.1 cobalt transporter subunit CbtB [Halomonas xianhensis]